jgi:ABC-type branched-subunit amino acid transport system substrate-binding protein
MPKITGDISGPGVTASTITIGQVTTTSGPVPGLFQGANDGLDAVAAFVNANGGIAGRQLKVTHIDDTQDCNTYTQAMQRFSGSAFAVVGGFSLVDTCGKSTLQAHPTLPYVGYTVDPTLLGLPNVYSAAPSPLGAATTGYEWVKQKFPNDIKHTAALIPTSLVAGEKQIQLTTESLGYKYVYSRNISNTETNFTSDILRMKNLGVKIVDFSEASIPMLVNFVQQAHQQGFKYDAMFGGGAYDSSFLKSLPNPGVANNLYTFGTYPNYLGSEANSAPGLQTLRQWLTKVKSGAKLSTFSINGWSSGLLFVQALAGAGPNITQASLLKALSSITGWTGGGVTAPFNVGQKQGTACVVVIAPKDGTWTRVAPASGYDCDGTYHNVSPGSLG